MHGKYTVSVASYKRKESKELTACMMWNVDNFVLFSLLWDRIFGIDKRCRERGKLLSSGRQLYMYNREFDRKKTLYLLLHKESNALYTGNHAGPAMHIDRFSRTLCPNCDVCYNSGYYTINIW